MNQNLLSLDRFGGLESVQFAPSGYFRLEKADRWWLVTPDGGAFLSFGLNHTSPEYLLQDYNISFWRKQFGFQEPSEAVFNEKFREKALNDLALFGMNTIGCHAPKEEFGELTVPYIQGLFLIRTAYWLNPSADRFPDVYSEPFKKNCEGIAERVVKPLRDDPFLIGYTFTNVPILTDLDADSHGQVAWGGAQPNMPTWPRALRNRGSDRPGKKAFVALVRDRYSSIQEFNDVYHTSFGSFDELLKAENWSPVTKDPSIEDAKDNLAFLLDIVDQYYSVACTAFRTADPNHLIFGDPLNANTGVPDEVVATIGRHTDLISYQYYGDYEEQAPILNRWAKLIGKPFFHTDSCFSVAEKEMPAPIGPTCPNQEDRANRTVEFASQAFARPDFLGWNWCGWMDAWIAWKPERQHSGLQDPFGRYHHPMPEALAQFGARLYEFGMMGMLGAGSAWEI